MGVTRSDHDRIVLLEDYIERRVEPVVLAVPGHIDNLYDVLGTHLENDHAMGPVNLRNKRPLALHSAAANASPTTAEEAVARDRAEFRERVRTWTPVIALALVILVNTALAVWAIASRIGGM